MKVVPTWRQDIERKLAECIWLELKKGTKAPNMFVCFLYRNLSVSYECFGNFVQMTDNIHTVKPHVDILILRDFNIDLLKPHSSYC